MELGRLENPGVGVTWADELVIDLLEEGTTLSIRGTPASGSSSYGSCCWLLKLMLYAVCWTSVMFSFCLYSAIVA